MLTIPFQKYADDNLQEARAMSPGDRLREALEISDVVLEMRRNSPVRQRILERIEEREREEHHTLNEMNHFRGGITP